MRKKIRSECKVEAEVLEAKATWSQQPSINAPMKRVAMSRVRSYFVSSIPRMQFCMKKPLKAWTVPEDRKSVWRPVKKMLLNGGMEGVGALENGDADRKETTFEMGGACSGEEGFGSHMFDCCCFWERKWAFA